MGIASVFMKLQLLCLLVFVPLAKAHNEYPAAAAVESGFGVYFDGIDDYMQVSDIDLSGRSFTVEVWVKRQRTKATETIVSQGTGKTGKGLHFGFLSNDQMRFTFWGDGNCHNLKRTFGAGAASTEKEWHHFAATFDIGKSTNPNKRVGSVYKNGILIATCIKERAFTGKGLLLIGRNFDNQYAHADPFKGSMTELRLWKNIALHRSKIRLYQSFTRSTITKWHPDKKHLEGYWRMEDGHQSRKVVDSSGNHHHAHLRFGVRFTTGLPIEDVATKDIRRSLNMDESLVHDRGTVSPTTHPLRVLWEYYQSDYARRKLLQGHTATQGWVHYTFEGLWKSAVAFLLG